MLDSFHDIHVKPIGRVNYKNVCAQQDVQQPYVLARNGLFGMHVARCFLGYRTKKFKYLIPVRIMYFLPQSCFNPALHGEGGGGLGAGWAGTESAHTNFKDSYLRNDYCYCNNIWRLFIQFIEEDSGVLIRSVVINSSP